MPPITVRILRWRRGSLAFGLGVGAAMISIGLNGNDAFSFLAGPVLGVCVLAGCLIGEFLVPAPKAPVRTAGLRRRRIRDYVSRGQAVLLVALTVLLVAMLWLTSVSFTGTWSPGWVCTPHTVRLYFPAELGMSYGAPLLAALSAGAVLSLLALRRIVHRPPLTAATGDPSRTAPTDLDTDEAQRRTSIRSVVFALGAALSASLGTAALAPGGLLNGICPDSTVNAGVLATLVTGATGYVCLAYFLVRLARVPTTGKDGE